MKAYLDILDQAFAPNIDTAFNGSILLARQFDVPAEEILTDMESINNYYN